MSEDVRPSGEPTRDDLADLDELARIAWQAWAEEAPTALGLIDDPRAHFSMLSRQAQVEEDQMIPGLQGPDRPGESTIQKAGRIRQAQGAAREVVIAEMLRPPEQVRDPQYDDLDHTMAEALATGVSYYLLPWVSEKPDRKEDPDLWEEYQDRLWEKKEAQEELTSRQQRHQELIGRAKAYLGLTD